MKNRWLVFTDLDGTLLDFDHYDFRPALPAIEWLQSQGIPIIPCTSKTYLEVDVLRKKLGISDPFIVENGSAIFFEPGYFKKLKTFSVIKNFHVILLGKKRSEILEFFKILKTTFNLKVKGFSEMEIKEIMKYTNLTAHEASMAQNRLFSEPMVYLEKEDLLKRKEVLDFINENNFKLLKGNRFYHLIGQCDKGMATQKLTEIFTNEFQCSFLTLGLGDSKNDAEMLKVVNQPIIIRKKDGNFVHLDQLKNVYISQQPGPAGWSEAIFYFLKH